VRVDLGSAPPIVPGFDRYVDLVAHSSVPSDKMIVADLNAKWPFEDASVSFFRAHDVIEHLQNKINTLNEMWRCLVSRGIVEIVVPTTDGRGAFQDPTHVTYWNRNSFFYHTAGDPCYVRFAALYGIRGGFNVLESKEEVTPDGPKLTIVLQKV
jgi:SAM-dependent methyltransferase